VDVGLGVFVNVGVLVLVLVGVKLGVLVGVKVLVLHIFVIRIVETIDGVALKFIEASLCQAQSTGGFVICMYIGTSTHPLNPGD
jgi:hypothetical protein